MDFINGPHSLYILKGQFDDNIERVIYLIGDYHGEQNECEVDDMYKLNKYITENQILGNDLFQFVYESPQNGMKLINIAYWILNTIKLFELNHNDNQILDIYLEHIPYEPLYNINNVNINVNKINQNIDSHVIENQYFIPGALGDTVHMLESIQCGEIETKKRTSICNFSRVHYIDQRPLIRDSIIGFYGYQGAFRYSLNLNILWKNMINSLHVQAYGNNNFEYLSKEHIWYYITETMDIKYPLILQGLRNSTSSEFNTNYNIILKDFIQTAWEEVISVDLNQDYDKFVSTFNYSYKNKEYDFNDLIVDFDDLDWQMYIIRQIALNVDALFMDINTIATILGRYENTTNKTNYMKYGIVYTGNKHTINYLNFFTKYGFQVTETYQTTYNEEKDMCLNVTGAAYPGFVDVI